MKQIFARPDRYLSGLIPAILSLMLVTGCDNGSAGTALLGGGEEEETPPVPVEVLSPLRGDVFAMYSGTASLETEEEALVVAKVGGEVEELRVEESDRVEAGQILGREKAAVGIERLEVAIVDRRRHRVVELRLAIMKAFHDLGDDQRRLSLALVGPELVDGDDRRFGERGGAEHQTQHCHEGRDGSFYIQSVLLISTSAHPPVPSTHPSRLRQCRTKTVTAST